MIKKIKCKHWHGEDAEQLAKAGYVTPRDLEGFGPAIGRDHYYYVKGNDIVSLIDVPSAFVPYKRIYEICHPNCRADSIEECEEVIKEHFKDNEFEFIDWSDEALDQRELRQRLGMPPEIWETRYGQYISK